MNLVRILDRAIEGEGLGDDTRQSYGDSEQYIPEYVDSLQVVATAHDRRVDALAARYDHGKALFGPEDRPPAAREGADCGFTEHSRAHTILRAAVYAATEAYLQEHPTADYVEIFREVPSHYQDPHSMRNAMREERKRRKREGGK